MDSRLKTIFTEKVKGSTVVGRLTGDRIKLFLDAERAVEATFLSRQDLIEALCKYVDMEMLNLGVVDDIVCKLNEGTKRIERRRVAVGVTPESGRDGKVVLLKKIFSGKAVPLASSEPMVNYTRMHLFDNILCGDEVARVYPPRPGKDGRDALGRVIPAQAGRAAALQIDSSLALKSPQAAANFQTVVSSVEGCLFEEQGRLGVRSELCIRDDIDYRYGSIDFIGKVVVGGDVMPGFNVAARKGIHIKGSVRGGSLVSSEGDIDVEGHVFGGSSSRVITARTFSALVVQAVDADVRGTISVRKEARDSILRTQDALIISNGALVGGLVYAVKGVEAKIIGSKGGADTQVWLCSDVEATADYGRLTAELAAHDKALALLRLYLGPYAENPTRIMLLNATFREKMQRFHHKLDQVERSRMRLLLRKERMLAGAKGSEGARVNVLQKIFPGVKIGANDREFAPHEVMKGPLSLYYQADDESIVSGELVPLTTGGSRDSKVKGGGI